MGVDPNTRLLVLHHHGRQGTVLVVWGAVYDVAQNSTPWMLLKSKTKDYCITHLQEMTSRCQFSVDFTVPFEYVVVHNSLSKILERKKYRFCVWSRLERAEPYSRVSYQYARTTTITNKGQQPLRPRVFHFFLVVKDSHHVREQLHSFGAGPCTGMLV